MTYVKAQILSTTQEPIEEEKQKVRNNALMFLREKLSDYPSHDSKDEDQNLPCFYDEIEVPFTQGHEV